jgi:C-terminal processing protease CtpA/Prc
MVVLIGHGTESFAEVMAGALQHVGRAQLIGQNTAGNIETLLSHEFEDGSRLWLAQETFRLPDGTNWEGVGVTPDIRIDKGWDEYTAENDPVIAEAVKQLSR